MNLQYHPDGSLYWTAGRYKDLRAGTVRGPGYRSLQLGGIRYPTSHIVWRVHHGELPASKIRHINGDILDDRIENLAQVDDCSKMHNTKMYSNNTSGVKGVYWRRDTGKWVAYIGVNHRMIGLGNFTDKDKAAEARRKAEERYFDRQLSGSTDSGECPAIETKEETGATA